VLPVVQKWCLYYIFVNDIIHWCRHEIAGVVTQVGADVKGFKVGDHVGVGTYVNSCRDCENCNSSLENHCPERVFTFNGIDTDGTVTKGGYSTHIVVHERYGSTVLLGCSNKIFFILIKASIGMKTGSTVISFANLITLCRIQDAMYFLMRVKSGSLLSINFHHSQYMIKE